ncbi:MAG: hypothetical protein NT018_14200 [Armatimonadetes bacterium]|nr:hypothetical protein [Armatimonadota bacterium]
MRGKVGLLFALRQEESGFERVMTESRSNMRRDGWLTAWRIGGIELMTAVSGVGRKRCADAALKLIECGAESIICAGFAAALHPNARVGDIFAAERVILLSDTEQPVLKTSRALAYAVPPHGPNGSIIRHAWLITSDKIILNASDKARLFHATGASILDMESYAAARLCNELNIPFLAIRSVSDSALQDIPAQISDLLSFPDQFSKVMFAVSRPHLWLYLIRLRSQAKLAAANLGDTLATMVLRMI